MVSVEILQDKDFQDLEINLNTDLYAEKRQVTENDISYTQMYLPTNTYIICDPLTSVTSTPSNLTQFTYGYIVNNTGIVTISGNFTLCYIGVTKVL